MVFAFFVLFRHSLVAEWRVAQIGTEWIVP
jgi:hypothetical protein